MKEFIPLLKRTKLFSGVGDEELYAMINCLQGRIKDYEMMLEYDEQEVERLKVLAKRP